MSNKYLARCGCSDLARTFFVVLFYALEKYFNTIIFHIQNVLNKMPRICPARWQSPLLCKIWRHSLSYIFQSLKGVSQLKKGHEVSFMPFVQRNMLQILYDWLKLSGGSLVVLYCPCCDFWAYYAFGVLSRKFWVI